MPRKRWRTHLSGWPIPKIDPNDPVLVEDHHRVRGVLDDFEELTPLSSEVREQLVAALVHAMGFWRGGVKLGKPHLSNKAAARDIFMSNVGRALEQAGIRPTRWRKRYDRGDGPRDDVPESPFFRLARELADAFGMSLPKDLKLSGQRARNIKYGVMSSSMKVAQDAELAIRWQRAKLIGLIQAPATKIAQVLNAPAAKVAREAKVGAQGVRVGKRKRRGKSAASPARKAARRTRTGARKHRPKRRPILPPSV